MDAAPEVDDTDITKYCNVSAEVRSMRTEDIQPLSEHRAKLTEHLKRARETGRPLFVTSNGKPAAVVLSPEAYDNLVEKAELAENLAMIVQSVEDLESGRTQEARKSIRDLARKHGVSLDR